MFVWIGLTEAAFSLDENSGKVPFTIQLEMPGEKPRPSADAFVVVPSLKRVGHDSPLGSTTLFTASQTPMPSPRVTILTTATRHFATFVPH